MKSRYPYPWFYGCMSLCIPGLGQFMLGRKLQGCLFFLIQITASVTAYFVLISETFLGLIPAAALILAAYLFIPLNAIHAARIA